MAHTRISEYFCRTFFVEADKHAIGARLLREARVEIVGIRFG